MLLRTIVALSAATLLTAPALAQSTGDLDYPESRQVDQVDDYHGEQVHDPYRWLENDVREDDEVKQWVKAQNRVTNSYLQSIPERAQIRSRLEELWDYEKIRAPFSHAGVYYFFRNDGLQNQDVLYHADSLDGEQTVLFDPNTWSEDGTVALAGMSFSDDGRYLAYGRSAAGSDWKTWQIRDLETGKDLDDELKWIKWSGASWTKDGRGFFYTRYDEPAEGAFVALNEYPKMYYHRVGTDQASDVLVYHNPYEPKHGFGGRVTDDGRYLIISTTKGTGDKNLVSYKDLTEPYGAPIVLIDKFENDYAFLGNDGPRFYFYTDLDAPMGRVIAVNINDAHRDGGEDATVAETLKYDVLIPQSSDVLQGVGMVGNLFVARYLKDAKTAVQMFDMRGNHVRDVDFPGIGSAFGFGGERTDTETFYTYQSFTTPPRVYRYDMITGENQLLNEAQVPFDQSQFETKQVFYTSKDGTKVPMFLVHKKGLDLNGSNPTLLYGYGGFDISLTPSFSITRLAWVEMGGVYAVANLRGGGEYGEEWHKAGTKLDKQNVFDDFIAAAEWLIANRYTSSDKLAIQGGSNGGLLVGACMAQRPDLFGACLPAVGVMDMLRFHKFTIGWAWVDDYGSSDDPDEFKALRKYSPVHNLTPGTAYPATLITTADTDDRVVPGHSFKFAAALQYAHSGEDPVLIRIEESAGHGAGKPTSKRIDEAADVWAFLVDNLEMTLD